MPIGMRQRKRADIPRFISWRHGHRHAVLQRELICFINSRRRFQPPAHPCPTGFVVTYELRIWSTARTLSALTKKDFRFAVANRAESRRRPFFMRPVPGFLPTKLREPLESLDNVRDVEDRRDSFDFHSSVPLSVRVSLLHCRSSG